MTTATDPLKVLPIDLFGQVSARTYTRTMVMFAYCSPTQQQHGIEQLEDGLLRVLRRWPFLCGHVTPTQANESQQLVGRVEVRYQSSRPEQQDLNRILTMATLTDAQFPSGYSNINYFEGMPSKYLQDQFFFNTPSLTYVDEPMPVFKAQITFCAGGLAVAMCTHHAVLDGGARFQVLQEWSRACHSLNPAFKHKFEGVNLDLDRVDLSPPWPSTPVETSADIKTLLHDCPEYFQLDDEKPLRYHSEDTLSRFFVFSGEYVQGLKERINTQIEADQSLWLSFVSKRRRKTGNDEKMELDPPPTPVHPKLSSFVCLTALIWHHLMLARLPHLDLTEESTFATLVDLRARGIAPENYFPGNAVLHTIAKVPLAKVVSTAPDTLAKLALKIKAAIDAVDEEYVSKRTKLFASVPDVRRLSNIGEVETIRRGAGMICSSWTDFGMDTQWDIRGACSAKPEFYRKPHAPAVGYACVFPRRKGVESDWEVQLGFEARDRERLVGGLGQFTKRIVG
ncbi:hypothetical protein NA57DRAFT_61466 [Rhizodiscina lignyota]|uniref:Trichothecene 3-O-acetyltransferase-like N-terminal domain-containing protein n=1 Tax=Rhizodiscina lignyota TaxID=1504668 RepID=A0A9P4M1D8_9PEZI|nr:hypothetical protein NA57DRAFT_61466 [Rhizodiscina lignyota]